MKLFIAVILALAIGGCVCPCLPTAPQRHASPPPVPPPPVVLITSSTTVALSFPDSLSSVLSLSTNWGVLDWRAAAKPAWLLMPTSGHATTSPSTVALGVDVTALPYEDSAGTLTLVTSRDTVQVVVRLSLPPPDPEAHLVVAPQTLNLTSYNHAHETLTFSTTGRSLGWRLASKPTWASVVPSSGTATHSGVAVVVTASAIGLPYGEYTGEVVFVDANGESTTMVINFSDPGR